MEVRLTFILCFFSQFEESFEDIPQADEPSNVPDEPSNVPDVPSNLPSTSGLPENHDVSMPMKEESTERNMETQEVDDTQRVYSDIESHDFVDGIMKIVPPDLDVSPNCFLSLKFSPMYIITVWKSNHI
jgi:transcription factor E2F3